MKTLFQFSSTMPDGKKAEHKLEMDDMAADAVVQSIHTATHMFAVKAEAEARTAALRAELFREAGAAISSIVSTMGGSPTGVANEPVSDERSFEARMIDDIMAGLTEGQRFAVFGEWSEGKCVKEGILTASQVGILSGVANGGHLEALNALVVDESPDRLTETQQARISATLGADVGKIMPFVMGLQRRKELLERQKKMEAEAEERARYVPEPPRRIEIEDGRIAYEAVSVELVQPGACVSIGIGVPQPVEGTGWPGLPETQAAHFGPVEDLKPEEIDISDRFLLVGAFAGSQNMLPFIVTEGIAAEHLEPGKPQPDYPVARKGVYVTVQVKNVSDRQRPAWVRMVGRPVVVDAVKEGGE